MNLHKEIEDDARELQGLEESLGDGLPPIPPILIETARSELKLQSIRQTPQQSNNYNPEFRCQEIFLENAEKLAKFADLEHQELIATLQDLWEIYQKLSIFTQ